MSTDTQEIAVPTAPVEAADTNAAPDVQEQTAVPETDQPKQEERRFTQAELDAAIQKRLLKEERRVHRRVEQQLREEAQRQQSAIEPKREAFVDDAEYAKAQIEHIAAKKAEELLAQRERQREAERRTETFQQKAEAAAERYVDFDAVVNNPSLPINEHMAEYITDSDVAGELAYYLGKNLQKAAQIAQMTPIKAARELSRIESEIASKPKAQVSKAPEPITPVNARGKSSSTALPSDEDSIEVWMQKERARIAARR